MRAFIALEIPGTLRHELADIINHLRCKDAKVKWVSTDQIHLTIKFLGDITDEQANFLSESVIETADNIGTLKIGVGTIGAFPRKKQPRVIWAGVRESEALSKIQQSIENAAISMGIDAEKRKWSPHITLGRVKYLDKGSSLPRKLRDINLVTTFVYAERLTLFKSTLTPEGPIYEPICSARFG